MTQNQIAYQSHLESKRHNLVSEGQENAKISETGRHNRVTEAQGWEANDIRREGNAINWFNAKENQRHNKAGEQIGWANYGETSRHNQVTEEESHRHNFATEMNSWGSAVNNFMQWSGIPDFVEDSLKGGSAPTHLHNSTLDFGAPQAQKEAVGQKSIDQYKTGKANRDRLANKENFILYK